MPSTRFYWLPTNTYNLNEKGSHKAAFFFLVLLAQINEMKTILLSTAYLPPISWMALAAQSDEVRIESCETYPKQTYRNRCNIAVSSGVLSLTVPVKKVNGNHTITRDTAIDNSGNWQSLHWRSIITAYSKSPYFLFYRDIFEPLFENKYHSLLEFNHNLLLVLFKAMQIKNKELIYTKDYEFAPLSTDLRNSIHPKIKLQHQLVPHLPRYIQTFEEIHGFIPDLSVIDLLFNLGPESLDYLMNLEIQFPK